MVVIHHTMVVPHHTVVVAHAVMHIVCTVVHIEQLKTIDFVKQKSGALISNKYMVQR